MKKNYKLTMKPLLIMFVMTTLSLTIYSQNAWINEIHYDNASTDVNESVEIVIQNPGDYTLSLFSVLLYNGSGGAVYNTKYLDAFSVGNTIGNFTIYHYTYPVDGIQNGAPDGLALAYNGTLISGQFLSYEGAFSGVGGPADGVASTNIGVSETSSTPVGYSLQLSGTGGNYSDYTWQSQATATAGLLNNGQTLISGAIENPGNFNAATYSTTQIDLSWELNTDADSILIAFNEINTFGTPGGVYIAGEPIGGGGTVLYKGLDLSTSHTGLNEESEYFYKAWSMTSTHQYSLGVVDSATTQYLEPSNHPTGFIAASNGPNQITVSWTDSDATHYLVKGSSVGYGSIVPPIDGIGQDDSLLVQNVDASVQEHQFNGLNPNTSYYFKIFPFNGGGESSNYKTDGTIPETSATTDNLEFNLYISEVADPIESNMRFVELYNAGGSAIDFSSDVVYFCRQSNGSSWGSVLLTGTIGSGETYIIGYSSTYYDTAYSHTPDIYSGFVNNNGDDGVFLYYGGDQTTGFLLDAFGVIDEDGTGTDWEYTDGHAVRNRGVVTPSGTWTSSEWTIVRGLNYKNMTPGVHAAEVTWQGTTSSDWNARGANWSGTYGWVPDASYNVTIPNVTTSPIITAPSACQAVEIQSGASLSIQSTGSLMIVGQ